MLTGEQNIQRTCRENFKCRLERSDSKELSLQTFLKVGELCISSCYKHILEEKTERQIHASTDCTIESHMLSLRKVEIYIGQAPVHDANDSYFLGSTLNLVTLAPEVNVFSNKYQILNPIHGSAFMRPFAFKADSSAYFVIRMDTPKSSGTPHANSTT